MLRAGMAKTKMSTAGNKGFTLLELVIVLFIVLLSVAVVVFSTGRLHERTLFNDETRRIAQTLKHAREISLMERRDVLFRINSEENKYWIEYGSSILNSHVLHEGIKLSGGDVIFFSKGNSSGGQIEIDNSNKQVYVIEIDPILGTPTVKRL